MADTLRHYEVRGFNPPVSGNKYGHNMTLGIVCYSATEAMNLVQKKYSAMRIDSVNDRGVISFIDPVLLVPKEITSEKANDSSDSIERTAVASGV